MAFERRRGSKHGSGASGRRSPGGLGLTAAAQRRQSGWMALGVATRCLTARPFPGMAGSRWLDSGGSSGSALSGAAGLGRRGGRLWGPWSMCLARSLFWAGAQHSPPPHVDDFRKRFRTLAPGSQLSSRRPPACPGTGTGQSSAGSGPCRRQRHVQLAAVHDPATHGMTIRGRAGRPSPRKLTGRARNVAPGRRRPPAPRRSPTQPMFHVEQWAGVGHCLARRVSRVPA